MNVHVADMIVQTLYGTEGLTSLKSAGFGAQFFFSTRASKAQANNARRSPT